MAKRTLSPSDNGKSGRITLPKGDLELDGAVDPDGNVEKHPVDVRRTSQGRYEVIILDADLQPLEHPESNVDPEAAD